MAVRNQLRQVRDQRGFTLIEVTIILLVLVILSTMILPQLGNFNRLARFVKVVEDVTVLCSGMKKMLDETMENAFWLYPESHTKPVGLLYGDGSVPSLSSLLVASTDANWLDTDVGTLSAVVVTDTPSQVPGEFWSDHYMNHFLMNNPGGWNAEHYDDIDDLSVEWWAFGWHGPYFDKIMPDPWGNRYASNVFALHSVQGNVYTSAVVVLSAGPDETIDTPFDMFYKTIKKGQYWGTGYTPGRDVDDVVCVLSAGGPF